MKGRGTPGARATALVAGMVARQKSDTVVADWELATLSEDQIYDRTRSMIHVNGTKWVGTPAGQSATNAELATNTNWNLVFQTADRCGIVQIKTNG
jgi:hypothetical protein